MFRNLILLIAIIVAVWLIRRLIITTKTSHTKTIDSKDMVQCEHCKIYVPREDAINLNEKSFCSQQHLEDWNQQH